MASIKVVLLQNVSKLGKIGDVRPVAAGYARNYLLPQGLAITATPRRLADAQFQRELEVRREEVQRHEDERAAGLIQGANIVIEVQVGAQGRMHGQITNQDVARALSEQLGTEIDRHNIQIDSPIRSLGRYLLPVSIAAGLEASVTLEVTERIEAPEEPAADEAEETTEAGVVEVAEGDIEADETADEQPS